MKLLWARQESHSERLKRKNPWNCCSVIKNSNALRGIAVVVVALAIAGLFYQFAHDVRMSVFIFLVTAFAGSMFAMISIVTREN